jgi:signal peptidase I
MKPLQRFFRFAGENRGFLAFILLMLVFRSAAADWMVVPSGSMNPTIVEGDRILVNKAAYGWRVPFTTVHITRGADPQRGDIATFTSPADGKNLVKRVIGVPGDIIEMRDDRLFVNGTALNYRPVNDPADASLLSTTRAQNHHYQQETLGGRAHSVMLLPDRYAMRSFGPVTVPSGHYFMMGDSRDDSFDSRYIGFVPRGNILGRAFTVAYSLDPERGYRPRTNRFMSPLG